MIAKINSMSLCGIQGQTITVEADVSDGLPGFVMSGYLASEVREAQDRVRTAIRNLNLNLYPKKITINLSPADIRKEGTGFDVAIAIAVLMAHGMLPAGKTERTVFVGELGLDGSIKGIPGILVLTAWAKECGFQKMVLPESNLREASFIPGIDLIGVKSLDQLVRLLRNGEPVKEHISCKGTEVKREYNQYSVDFSEVNGQAVLRRAAEVAASGGHNLMMIGPAGSGKTMVAKRIATILPPMTMMDCIEVSKVYSVNHMLSDDSPLITVRPFRAPHHTVTDKALIGGGSRPRPGEISLANGGILFLDELPEMSRTALEALRQPLEEKQVTISRLHGNITYPAKFQLVAALNPCLCGHYPDLSKCTCTASQIRRYLSRVSRPLLDRIDICVETMPMSFEEVAGMSANEDSATIRERVICARNIQKKRYRGTGIQCNSEMSGAMVREFCAINLQENRFLESVFGEMKFSARMYDKILKVARTIADMAEHKNIEHADLCEAISYVRVRERYWRS